MSKWRNRIEEEKLKQDMEEDVNGFSELTYQVNPVEIKMACVGFARDILTSGTPAEVFEYARKLFAWITQDDD